MATCNDGYTGSNLELTCTAISPGTSVFKTTTKEILCNGRSVQHRLAEGANIVCPALPPNSSDGQFVDCTVTPKTGYDCYYTDVGSGTTKAANVNVQCFAGSRGLNVVLDYYCKPTNTAVTPSCTANSCDASAVPTNGTIGDCTATLASGTSCTPTCSTGYTGSGGRSCNTGTLTDNFTCTANSCDASAVPSNGTVGDCTSNLASGASCTPTCSNGYIASGRRKCIAGTLNPNTFTCTAATCADPTAPSNGGTGNCTGKTTGQQCTATCNDGYVGTNLTLTCTGKTGGTAEFDLIPSCAAATCTNPIIPNGTIGTCNNKKTTESCTATCHDGYAGSNLELTCTANLNAASSVYKTSTKTIICNGRSVPIPLSEGADVVCPTHPPNSPDHVVVNCTTTAKPGYDCYFTGSPGSGESRLPTAVSVQCYAGSQHGINGVSALLNPYCKPTTTAITPSCTASTCANPATPSNGTIGNCTGKTTGQQCTATCSDGYSGTNLLLTCTGDSGAPTSSFKQTPSCTAATCANPTPPLNGSIGNCKGKTTGESCKATCDYPYKLKPASLTCTATQGATTSTYPSTPRCVECEMVCQAELEIALNEQKREIIATITAAYTKEIEDLKKIIIEMRKEDQNTLSYAHAVQLSHLQTRDRVTALENAAGNP